MHSYISDLKEQYQEGKVSRRDFMRNAALLGLSLTGISSFLSGCDREQAAEPTASPAATAAVTVTPTAEVGMPKRGGELVVAEVLRRLVDPHQTGWQEFNMYQLVNEHLTTISADNITVPWLLESWEPSEDLMTWTLRVRQGINFSDGRDLTADDVIWNIKRWLDPEVGSPTAGVMYYLQPTNIGKVDEYTVELRLDSPQIGVAEGLDQAILSPDFDGNWTENPVGTGPYTLEEYIVEERAVFRRRDGYYEMGADGKPLPYIDTIRFIHLGEDQAAIAAGLNSGEVDFARIRSAGADELRDEIQVVSKVNAYTSVIRMRADVEPFDKIQVRNAIKACQDRPQILEAVMRDYGGALGADYHVSPVHPAYCPMDIPERDIEKAKALLADAGFEDGLELTINVIDAEPDRTIAQLLKQQCAPAGISIDLEMMPASLYWERWLEVEFGITGWAHRPLATQALVQAYRSDAMWNETHWSNEEFDRLLDQALGTVDVDDRREIMCQIQKLMKEEGPVAIAFWGAFLRAHNNRVRNFEARPTEVTWFVDVWLDDEA